MLGPFLLPPSPSLVGVLSEEVLRLTGLFLPTHLPILPHLGADSGGRELNFESRSASTRIVHSLCCRDTRLMCSVASVLFKYALFFFTVQAHHQQQL